ncbi:hypothetical protein LC593_25180 [Nostoc sp. CHAB 5844]|nr:hypothetical protein [Nostoc sp. CHAB 5844]
MQTRTAILSDRMKCQPVRAGGGDDALPRSDLLIVIKYLLSCKNSVMPGYKN